MTNDFREWCKRLGFNGKQLSAAGSLIGISARNSSLTASGHRELSPSERLAMSAVRVGLLPWTPGYDAALTAASSGSQTASASEDPQVADTQE
jgi:hypothetical protein